MSSKIIFLNPRGSKPFWILTPVITELINFHPLALQPYHFLSYIIFFLIKNYQTVVLTAGRLKIYGKKKFSPKWFLNIHLHIRSNTNPSYVLKIFSLEIFVTCTVTLGELMCTWNKIFWFLWKIYLNTHKYKFRLAFPNIITWVSRILFLFIPIWTNILKIPLN